MATEKPRSRTVIAAPSEKLFDNRIPLTWLISTIGAVVAVLIGVAVQFNSQSITINSKIDVVIAAVQEQKAANVARDAKTELLHDSVAALRSSVDVVDARVTNVEHSQNTLDQILVRYAYISKPTKSSAGIELENLK